MEDAIEEMDAIVESRWSRHRAVTRAMADRRRSLIVHLSLTDEDEEPVPTAPEGVGAVGPADVVVDASVLGEDPGLE
ncbi:MAG: hypothetical protein ACRDRN_24540 [Sciscionella sp.]